METESGAGAGAGAAAGPAAILGGIMSVGRMMVMMMIMSVVITVVFVEGLFFMVNTTDLGTLLVHEFVVHGAFFPRNFLLPRAEFEDEGFLRLRRRGGRARGVLDRHGGCHGGHR